MIAPAVVSEIRALLAAGELSQRKIARRVGVSRGTVNAIALGKRADCATRRSDPAHNFTPPSGLPRRCPGCGGTVRMPCLACHVRAIKQRQRATGRPRCQNPPGCPSPSTAPTLKRY